MIENKKANEVVVSVKGTNTVRTKGDVISKMDPAKLQGLNITSINAAASNSDTRIRLGGVSSINTYNQPLLVIDDVQSPLSRLASLNPNDVESVKILKGAVAFALYGSASKDGVIIISTKKKALAKMQMTKDTIAKKIINKISDKISLTINTNTIKIYPNPVQKVNTFFVSFKQQKVNDFNIRITDIQGRVMIQKQVNASAKEHFEKILTDAGWSSGIYYISIIDNKNQLVNKTSFILQ